MKYSHSFKTRVLSRGLDLQCRVLGDRHAIAEPLCFLVKSMKIICITIYVFQIHSSEGLDGKIC